MDLQNPRWMWIKAGCFVAIALLCAGQLWMQHPGTGTLLLLFVFGWACCRAYYFAFYVIEKYIDPGYRFSGLLDFLRYAFRRRG